MVLSEHVTDRTGEYHYWLGTTLPPTSEPPFWLFAEYYGEAVEWRKWDGNAWVSSRTGELLAYTEARKENL